MFQDRKFAVLVACTMSAVGVGGVALASTPPRGGMFGGVGLARPPVGVMAPRLSAVASPKVTRSRSVVTLSSPSPNAPSRVCAHRVRSSTVLLMPVERGRMAGTATAVAMAYPCPA
jgi:hypothetical protein